MGHNHDGRKGGVIFGMVLIALGAVFLAGTIFGLDAGDLLRTWWPVILIVFGLKGLLGRGHGTFWPLFVVVIGALFLVRNLGVIDHGIWGYIWPIGLVLLGLHILTGPWRSSRRVEGPSRGAGEVGGGETFDAVVVFSHQVRRIRSDGFGRGEGTAVFGSLELDLREATILPDARLEVNAVFGAVKVHVPAGVRLALGGNPVFGGVSDKRGADRVAEDAPVLHLEANAVFGGVEIL